MTRQKTRLFFHKSSGSIVTGVFPWFKITLDWRDAADGITWIRPVLHISGYPEYRK